MKKRIVREIGTLAIGGLAAQAIGLALSPVVARLYAPESYAVLTVFLTVVTTCLPAICGKYEIAVVVAGTDRHARELVGLCFWLAGAISGTLLIVTLFFGEYITSWLGGPNLGWWIVAAPPFMFVSAVTVIMTNHANRHREYRALSTLALVQAVAIALMNLTFGFMGLEATGLLIGNCLATLLGSLWILAKFRNSFSLSDMRWNEAKRDVAKKYLDFPLYNGTSTLLNAITLGMPVFFIAHLCSAETVGFYGLLMRVAQVPLAVISGSVMQVLLRQMSATVREGQNATPFLFRVTMALLALVAVPTLVLVLWAPELFSWAFGERWREAGALLTILMPTLALQFVVSTVSPTFGATGHNALAAVWKVIAFLVTLAVFVFVAPSLNVQGIFVAIAITNAALYALYYALAWYCARNPYTGSHC